MHTVEYYWALQKEGYPALCDNMEKPGGSEIDQSQRDKYREIPLDGISEIATPMEAESRMMVAMS